MPLILTLLPSLAASTSAIVLSFVGIGVSSSFASTTKLKFLLPSTSLYFNTTVKVTLVSVSPLVTLPVLEIASLLLDQVIEASIPSRLVSKVTS